jgi:tellurite resistance protein TerC
MRRAARKTVVAMIGATILTSGVALIVLPGPASLVIPLGLMVLATEFSWAAKLLRQLGTRARRLKVAIGQHFGQRPQVAGSGNSA